MPVFELPALSGVAEGAPDFELLSPPAGAFDCANASVLVSANAPASAIVVNFMVFP
jgi:hypothetical protein